MPLGVRAPWLCHCRGGEEQLTMLLSGCGVAMAFDGHGLISSNCWLAATAFAIHFPKAWNLPRTISFKKWASPSGSPDDLRPSKDLLAMMRAGNLAYSLRPNSYELFLLKFYLTKSVV